MIVAVSSPPLPSAPQELYVVSPSSPHLSIEDFQKQGAVIFREYFDHADTQEVIVSMHLAHAVLSVLIDRSTFSKQFSFSFTTPLL